MDLAGKSIVITGASSGIGRELARQLAEQGARLALAARSPEALEATRSECLAAGTSAIAVATDVARQDDCRRLVSRAVEEFGTLDMLINNAGISMYSRFDEMTDLAVFQRLMDINLMGAVYCTHAALPFLKQTKGLLVAISSIQGKTGFPGSSAYSASKHAMQGFFDSLRIELFPTGVDVLVVSPGPVATSIHTRRLGGDGKLSDESLDRPNDRGMPVDVCARQIVKAIKRRRRELVMTAAGKAGQWVKLIAPGAIDHFIADAVERFYKER
jgi:short-subunit dehydrogenase